MLIVSCGFAVAADNGTGDSLGEDSSNADSVSESSDSAEQSSEDSSAGSASDSEDDEVNAEIDVDVVYDRNEPADNNSSQSQDTIDLSVHETANPLVMGLIAIMGIFLPLRRRN